MEWLWGCDYNPRNVLDQATVTILSAPLSFHVAELEPLHCAFSRNMGTKLVRETQHQSWGKYRNRMTTACHLEVPKESAPLWKQRQRKISTCKQPVAILMLEPNMWKKYIQTQWLTSQMPRNGMQLSMLQEPSVFSFPVHPFPDLGQKNRWTGRPPQLPSLCRKGTKKNTYWIKIQSCACGIKWI